MTVTDTDWKSDVENILRKDSVKKVIVDHVYDKDESFYVGVYNSFTESDCNLNISLQPNGNGVVTEFCVDEEGDNKLSEDKFVINWSVTDKGLLLINEKIETLFLYSSDLPCEAPVGFGATSGIFTTDQGGIFSVWNYFFKSPMNCK